MLSLEEKASILKGASVCLSHLSVSIQRAGAHKAKLFLKYSTI